MSQGGGAEIALAGGGGDVGKQDEVLPGLHPATELINVIQIPGSDPYGLR